jgi:hypothetical protein
MTKREIAFDAGLSRPGDSADSRNLAYLRNYPTIDDKKARLAEIRKRKEILHDRIDSLKCDLGEAPLVSGWQMIGTMEFVTDPAKVKDLRSEIRVYDEMSSYLTAESAYLGWKLKKQEEGEEKTHWLGCLLLVILFFLALFLIS